MKALILAAGVGSRLMPLTRNTPKSLLDLGDGYTLLERQLQSIGKAGLHDVVLVTGYKSEQIEAKLKDYRDFNLSIVYNPFYRMTNNIASAWLGLKDMNEPVVLINGDDLFQASVLERLLGSPADITLAISRKPEYDDDDMKVVTEGERLLDVGKDIQAERANGESIGIMLFRGRGLQDVKRALLDMVRVEENLQLFYLAALRRLMRENYPVHYAECGQDEWSEVDFHPDLDQMRSNLRLKLIQFD